MGRAALPPVLIWRIGTAAPETWGRAGHALGLEVELRGLEPPAGFLPAGKPILGQMRQERLLCLGGRDAARLVGEDGEQRIAHGLVFRAVDPVSVTGRGDVLDGGLVVCF